MYVYDKLYDASYGPNVRVPVLTDRMKAMLSALDNGGIVELIDEMYLIAEEDHELSDPKRMGGNKKSLRSSMYALLEDSQSGRKNAFDLLKSMNVDVIRACIDNTLGYRYKTSPEFRELFHEVDSRSGIYGYTIMLEGGTGEFLSSRQLQLLSKKIYLYARTEGKHDDADAVEIDRVYGGAGFDPEPSRCGQRTWLTPYHTKGFPNKTFILSAKLAERAELDKDGVTPQFQSPMAVGFSKNLEIRMSEHAIDSTLSSATKPWCLLLSCLKVMGISVSPVSVVLLKIWKDEHRALGEILITMLTSSLIDDCGYNPKQAGGNMGLDQGDAHYLPEMKSVFLEKTWIKENDNSTNKELGRRISTLKCLQGDKTNDAVAYPKTIARTQSNLESSCKESEKILQNISSIHEKRQIQQEVLEEEVTNKEKAIENQLTFLNILATHYK